MKVWGPVHKSDAGGVILNIQTTEQAFQAFEKLMSIDEAEGVILQQQLSGIEVYMGAQAEEKFGHQVVCGLGGIFVEVFKDISTALIPVSREEAICMIRRLRSYPIIRGARGKAGIDENVIAENIQKLSALLAQAPEIREMDVNPLIGNGDMLIAVDARISVA
jgi:acetyltransferase